MGHSRVLIINGSHRKGNTDILVEALKKEMEGKVAEARELRLREIEMKLPTGYECNSESNIRIKDQFSEEIEPTIRNYDVYIVATPTYSDAVTPLVKIFWDRIVSWQDEKNMYLKGKKLAIVAHGTADESSWKHPIDWIKGVCEWEECGFGGGVTFKSGDEPGTIELNDVKIKKFIDGLLSI
jgi:multimeric flavodoxin WrbA